ncbi:MAG: glucosaminidase domain-containing protein [Pseudomonadales bacterium]|nr:glucosaminidase domain-containing protein [Pseudomonadales bacterium]
MKYKLLTLIMACIIISACNTRSQLNEDLLSSDISLSNNQSSNTEDTAIASTNLIPDFTNIPKGEPRKKAFIRYLSPLIANENEKVRIQRRRLHVIEGRLNESPILSPTTQHWLDNTARSYGVRVQRNRQKVKQLLNKVDTIPQSLALAQASIESAWGTSRFARQANSYFGQWCFTKGCGLVPLLRSKGMTHEVRLYRTPSESVRSYISNLNRHPAYSELREIRRQDRIGKRYTSGCALTASLRNYSQEGGNYVESLKSIIRVNKLEPSQHIGSCKKSQLAST